MPTTEKEMTEYLPPNHSSPSMMKKSPLAMLVETCSSIGQELTRTTRPMETAAISAERRKLNSNSVSPPHHSKSTTPVSSGSSPKAHHLNRSLKSLRNLETTPVNPLLLQGGLANPNINGSNIAAAAAQYQLIYQQLLYQAEVEYMKTQELFTKSSTEKPKLCSICCLTPGYMGGPCIHTELSAATGAPINPLLAMLTNPLMASKQLLLDSNSILPQAAAAANSPPMKAGGHNLTNPFPLSKSPIQSKECHWVDGAHGYCGKKFGSQEDLMEHLRHHVANTTTEKQNVTKSIGNRHRFQPYSLVGRGLAPPLQN